MLSVTLYGAEALQSDDTKMLEALTMWLRSNTERFIWTENVEYETVLEIVRAQSIPRKMFIYLREALYTYLSEALFTSEKHYIHQRTCPLTE